MDYTYLHGNRMHITGKNTELEDCFKHLSTSLDQGISYQTFKKEYDSLEEIITPIGFDIHPNMRLYVSTNKLQYVPNTTEPEAKDFYLKAFRDVFLDTMRELKNK